MKGIVFVELLSMAEEKLGEAVVDRVIDEADLPSGGAYTAVGSYPCEELVALVDGFSRHSGLPGTELQRLFGHRMMEVFARYYPGFFVSKSDPLEMLSAVEDEIHVEVRKIYPEAELPTIDASPIAGGLEVTYRSSRPLQHFCHGLVEACVGHFGAPARIEMQDLSQGAGGHAVFTVRQG